MTKIFVFKKENKICGFQVKGHSGYADEGHDIVCSAISTAAQMALVGLKEVLKLDVDFEMMDGFMSVHLKKEDVEQNSAQTILFAMEKTFEEITKQYSRFVKMEVKKDVY